MTPRQRENAQHAINQGNRYPLDSLQTVHWTLDAARGIMRELNGRDSFGDAPDECDQAVLDEITVAIQNIIRVAHASVSEHADQPPSATDAAIALAHEAQSAVTSIYATHFGIGDVQWHEDIERETGLDENDRQELQEALEQRFSAVFDEREFEACRTASALVAFIVKNLLPFEGDPLVVATQTAKDRVIVARALYKLLSADLNIHECSSADRLFEDLQINSADAGNLIRDLGDDLGIDIASVLFQLKEPAIEDVLEIGALKLEAQRARKVAHG
ncbi:hypothetical protein BcepSauron_350 [Burkholderia phage BcepSauron]|uniref:Uncharacterized protein n=1 Tax=Burkholderia phage BcepSauron TaxID=2530033 RepID=A0A482MNN7_9CAUD|nr:hypothetical protein H1O17_gp350 [Burkholderia phage BcepSauron]QBQ74730.1 hypothetical protein BcepSauron_350 [Burkholderia phage BcepSauron]